MNYKNIGIDIVDISRVERIYNRFGIKFIERIFNPLEIDYIRARNNKAETIAALFSFKESIAKALGTGFTQGLTFKSIKIFHSNLGAPRGEAKGKKFLLSATHDGNFAVTVALIDGNGVDIPSRVIELYRPRLDKSHKGTFGKSMIITGSRGMVGAGYLSSTAALKSGCGLTYHYVSEEDEIFSPLSTMHIEVILKDSSPFKDLARMDSVLFGCGVGINRNKREVLRRLLAEDIQLIIDADGINMLAEDLTHLISKKAKVILTPHIMEFSRLTGEVVAPGERLYSLAKDFAKVYNVVLVLKDSKTIITDGNSLEIIDRENSGLATAGSGDVLAGIIASLVAQGYELLDAASLGVYIHSLSGEIASKKKSKTSMVARDIIDGLDDVFRILEER
ncbi:MAG: NAD(P)H-hydrate dehydratase [Neofamilia sp.]